MQNEDQADGFDPGALHCAPQTLCGMFLLVPSAMDALECPCCRPCASPYPSPLLFLKEREKVFNTYLDPAW